MSVAAILQIVIAILPYATQGVTELIAFIESLHTAAQQSAEWTPDMESAYVSALWAKTQDPKYAPDA